jgi:hypothetical protein
MPGEAVGVMGVEVSAIIGLTIGILVGEGKEAGEGVGREGGTYG